MAQDQRVPIMTAILTESLLALVVKQHNVFIKQYEVKEDQTDKFEVAFGTALRTALGEVRQRYEKASVSKHKKKFIHLFCGRVFPTREEAIIHSLKGECGPSKQTAKARAAQDRILDKNRKKAP